MHNLYGPTEAAIDVTSWACGPSDTGEQVPIGRPIANLQVFVLDPLGNRVPVGVAGELYLTGVGLAIGYLGSPALTAERFVRLPLLGGVEVRAYRTGDRVRFRPDGNLEFLGRLDSQVKIGGVRVEPAETEVVLRRCPGVRDCVVTASVATGSVLTAYVVPSGDPPDVNRLRDSLREALPAAFVPTRFHFLTAFPLTSSGKVNRSELREPVAPLGPPAQWETPSEELLARAWGEVLRLDRPDPTTGFFEAGGDSLRSLQLQSAVLLAGYEFSIAELLACRTIRALAPRLRRAGAVRPREPFALLPDEDAASFRAEYEDAFPLSRLQEGLLFHSHDGAYEVYVLSLRLREAYEDRVMRAGLASLARRHPMVRTGYDLSRPGRPVQCVRRWAEIPLDVVDLTRYDLAAQEELISRWVRAERVQPFDWASPPLLRFRVHILGPELFQLTVSHPVFDGWSVATLLTELLGDYGVRRWGAPAPDPPPPAASFADFVAAELAAAADPAAREFWRGRVSAAAPQPRSPTRATRVRREVALPDGAAGQLRKVARAAGVPLKSLLLAAHFRVLGLLTGRAVLTTGLITNGRPEATDGDRAVGLFLNTLPLSIRLGGETWEEAARLAFAAEVEVWPYRHYPFAEIRKLASDTPFDTVFNFVHFHNAATLAARAGVRVVGWENPSDFTFFPFAVYFVEDPLSGRLLLYLDYDANTQNPDQIDRTAKYYTRALAAAVDHSASPAGGAELLSVDELTEQQRWNATARRFALPDLPVHQLVKATAIRRPGTPAVRFGNEALSYGELDDNASRVAARLRDLGVAAEEPVGVYVGRGATVVAAVLGVMKSGAAFVPLSPEWPAERLAGVVADCGLRFVVTDGTFPAAHPRLTVVPATDDDSGPAPAGTTADNGTDRIAYVIYTSGSTGRPKGVEVTHAGLRNVLLAVADEVGVTDEDRWLALTGFAFDISILELLLPLVHGAQVTIASTADIRDGRRLARLLDEEPWTIAQATPSMWQLAVGGGWRGTGGQRVLCGGEPLSRALADNLLGRAAALWNLYGPTEATIWATTTRVRQGADEPPIGRPLANVTLHILGEAITPLPVGTPGELYLGGAGVAVGYRNRPDLTGELFLPDPGASGGRLYRTGDRGRFRSNGEVEFLGRVDCQVKVRGFRVELTEVEAGLARHPDLSGAAVVVRGDPATGQRLAAYVVLGELPVAATELAAFLAGFLPWYMIPAEFFAVPALPLTPNGKLDREALGPEAVPLTAGGGDEPQGEVERQIAAVWREVLRRDAVNRDDSFFLIGGDSLLALQVCVRLERVFGRPVPAAVLFEHPTITALAQSFAVGPVGTTSGAVAQARARRARAENLRPAAERRRGFWFLPRGDGTSRRGGADEQG